MGDLKGGLVYSWPMPHDPTNLNAIYLWRKVVCLFCFVCTYEIHWTGMLQIAFLVSLESSWGGGVHGLGFMTFGLVVQKVLEYWMTSSLKFSEELECAFGVVGKILMSRIKWNLFEMAFFFLFLNFTSTNNFQGDC